MHVFMHDFCAYMKCIGSEECNIPRIHICGQSVQIFHANSLSFDYLVLNEVHRAAASVSSSEFTFVVNQCKYFIVDS